MIPVNRSIRAAALAAGLTIVFLPAVARAQAASSQRVLAASSLPRLASDLRDEGVLPAELTMALGAMQAAKVAPADAARALKAEYQARLTQRSPDVEFGVLVREQLRKGVRGPALAAAVTAAREAKPTTKRKIQ
ncbi:MAG TPA: hypothetical protein VFO96_09685 [Gemmatimonadales bacterium]|jgi:hypothetical protein|nr:hypothetical protein [Gemmatimonadales bacterium]